MVLNILGQIAGVGKVKVLITEANGAETVYQTDENRSVSQDSENLKDSMEKEIIF